MVSWICSSILCSVWMMIEISIESVQLSWDCISQIYPSIFSQPVQAPDILSWDLEGWYSTKLYLCDSYCQITLISFSHGWLASGPCDIPYCITPYCAIPSSRQTPDPGMWLAPSQKGWPAPTAEDPHYKGWKSGSPIHFWGWELRFSFWNHILFPITHLCAPTYSTKLKNWTSHIQFLLLP